jgi:hypothetical protein
MLVTILMVLVKVIPVIPGHFTRYEWIALAIWAALGALLRVPTKRAEKIAGDMRGEQVSVDG